MMKGAAAWGEDPGEEALGLAPARAGVVQQRRPGCDQDGVDAVLLHERAGKVAAGVALVLGDGHDVVAAVGEGEDGLGELVVVVGGGWRCWLALRGGKREGRRRTQRQRRGNGGETASRAWGDCKGGELAAYRVGKFVGQALSSEIMGVLVFVGLET